MTEKLWTSEIGGGTANTGIVKMTQTTAQSISDSSPTEIDFDTTAANTTDALTPSTANNNVTVEEAGSYMVIARITYDGDSGWSTGDFAAVNISLNGSTAAAGEEIKVGTENEKAKSIYLDELSSGDAITAEAFQTSGSGKSTVTSGDRVFLSVLKLE